MCAIVGFWESSCGSTRAERERVALNMAAALRHRGPDDEGAWADPELLVALAHRRLAILDLSSEGHQPMHSADRRFTLVFNGEIYNFKFLRDGLEHRGYTFHSQSDTEVMLAAFSEWGILPALERFAGMFAFALWDRHEKTLYLARDRAGEKPLYYGWSGGVFMFGSELKALRAHPRWRGNIDHDALALMIRYGYVPAPHCIYENIHKLPAGCVLALNESVIRAQQLPVPTHYWAAQTAVEKGAANPFRGAENEARDRLHELLLQSVKQQMIADVPLGAFLSGGIDSSLVVALMQAQSRRPVKTFSIGFQHEQFNEAPFAKSVAAHLGTEHTELYVQDDDLQQIVTQLPGIYDEPMADSSQIPTVLLCRLTRANVTVSLSGDGGDELFAGYKHYRMGERIWKAIGWIPESVCRPLARQLKRAAKAGLKLPIPSTGANRLLNRLWNLSDVMPAASDYALYQLLMSPNRDPLPWLANARKPELRNGEFHAWQNLPELLQRMMWLDFAQYLPDDILVKVDRAAMSVSLETRIPLLDRQVIEFAWSLPTSLKWRGNQNKWLLRQLLYQYVPRKLVDRPKKGFAVPIADWLRGPLRDWSEHLLDETRLRQQNLFDPGQVKLKWQEHLSHKRDWSPGLWHTLMFQAWLDEQKVQPGESRISDLETAGKKKEVEPCPT